MEVMEEKIEFREEKEYKFLVKNDSNFKWEKSPNREIYYLSGDLINYFLYVICHDEGKCIPELRYKKEIVDYGFFYTTYRLTNNTYVQIFIETDNPEEEEINVTIWLFFFW